MSVVLRTYGPASCQLGLCDNDKETAIPWLSELTSDLVTRLSKYGVGKDESKHQPFCVICNVLQKDAPAFEKEYMSIVQDLHDLKRIVGVQNRLGCRVFRPIMYLHENNFTKLADVAGI